MNKYDKQFYEIEKKQSILYKYKKLKTNINLYKSLVSTGNIALIKKGSSKIAFYILFLAALDDDLQEKIIANIMNFDNKTDLIMFFMASLTRALTYNENIENINMIMNSFKKTQLIKNIRLEYDVFYLTMLDGKEISFSKVWDNASDMDKASKECHNFSYYILETTAKDRNDIYSVTILEKDIYNKDRYHTFLLSDGCIVDYARNICMEYDDYKKIHKFKTLQSIPSNQLFKNIEAKEKRDKEFENSNICKILKCAMDKQMKKDKKYKNR